MASQTSENVGLQINRNSQVSQYSGNTEVPSSTRQSLRQGVSVGDADSLFGQPIRPVTGYSESSTLNASSGQGSTDRLLTQGHAGETQAAEPSSLYANLPQDQKELLDRVRRLRLNQKDWYTYPTHTRRLKKFETEIVQLKPKFDPNDARHSERLTNFERDLLACVVQQTITPRKEKWINQETVLSPARMQLLDVISEWMKAHPSASSRPSGNRPRRFGIF